MFLAAVLYVSSHGNDAADGATPVTAWRHVQHAFDVAPAGSTVHVEAGRYREHLALHVSGSAAAGYTTFQADGRIILDGARRQRWHADRLDHHRQLREADRL